MTDKIGPSFASELAAAGVPNAVAWNTATGALTRCLDVTDADYAKAEAVLAAHDSTKPGPAVTQAPYGILKMDIVSRMTDSELDRFDAALTSAPTRARRMWTDCHEVRSDSDFFAGLRQQFTAAFDADRATAILAASTT